MENASKALLMAASVLIAMMVIAIGTYIFSIFGTFSKNQAEEIYGYQINQFNAQFTKYENTEDIYIHDIITLANFAKDYNDTNGITDVSDNAYISVNIEFPGQNYIERQTNNEKNNLIKYKTDKKYKLSGNIGYNSATGRVNKITFKEI